MLPDLAGQMAVPVDEGRTGPGPDEKGLAHRDPKQLGAEAHPVRRDVRLRVAAAALACLEQPKAEADPQGEAAPGVLPAGRVQRALAVEPRLSAARVSVPQVSEKRLELLEPLPPERAVRVQESPARPELSLPGLLQVRMPGLLQVRVPVTVVASAQLGRGHRQEAGAGQRAADAEARTANGTPPWPRLVLPGYLLPRHRHLRLMPPVAQEQRLPEQRGQGLAAPASSLLSVVVPARREARHGEHDCCPHPQRWRHCHALPHEHAARRHR
ncbi:MAG TPA: hypothetical protein VES20_19425 [Bryobacteraceae bacterium]|nr:hypothetical protein [Bryobacteraceae bacterium]